MKKQVFLSVTASKRLIGKALAERNDVLSAARNHTVVIIKGTTNAYLAECLCEKLNITGFQKEGFYRGILRPDGIRSSFPVQKNDLVISKGNILKDEDIYSITDKLSKDDIIFKGANAVNVNDGACAVLIMNPQFGTMDPISRAHFGRRVRLIHPVGLEKRVSDSLMDLAKTVNGSDTEGLRLAVSDGTPYTELDAFQDLFHVQAELIAAGGSGGYEGGCLFLLDGEENTLSDAISFAKENNALTAYQL